MRLTKERANSGRKHDEFICSDGHHCGVGGYCNNCPHTCTCNDIAADIQEGKPYRKGMLPCQACKNASLSARDGGLERLIARLKNAQHRVGQMCKERRPPKMRIPATPDDDDLFICDVITDAIAALSRPLAQSGEGDDEWKQQVVNGLMARFVYRAEHEHNPALALHDLLSAEVNLESAPASPESAGMPKNADSGKLEELINWCRYTAGCDGVHPADKNKLMQVATLLEQQHALSRSRRKGKK